MTKVIAFHSFRRGTGRTSLMANLAVLLTQQGKNVGIVDMNIRSPSAHILFKLESKDIEHTLDNYLCKECTLEQVIYDVGRNIGVTDNCLYLIPSSDDMLRIMQVLREEIDINRLTESFSKFASLHKLDFVFLDSSSGITEDIFLSISVADILVIVMRLDEQDYQGVSMTLELANRLGMDRSMLVINQVPSIYEPSLIEMQVSNTFKCEVSAALPHTEELLNLASEEIFVLQHPEHPLTLRLEKLTAKF